jgi:hypothetical protein
MLTAVAVSNGLWAIGKLKLRTFNSLIQENRMLELHDCLSESVSCANRFLRNYDDTELISLDDDDMLYVNSYPGNWILVTDEYLIKHGDEVYVG